MPSSDGSYRNLIETKRSGHELFSGHFLHAFRDVVVLPDASVSTREYIVHPGAVMVVPILVGGDGDIEVVLERQFRYPVGTVMLEFPAGKLDPGESPLHCAKRELQEETGFTALEWAYVGVVHPAIAYSTETIHVWFARKLAPGSRHLDDGEFLDVITAKPDVLLQWCARGMVTDAKTLSGILWLQNVLNGTWTLDWQTAEELP